MELEDFIYSAISAHIRCVRIEVSGDGRHFDALVISDDFINKTRLERHRMVYQSLGTSMQDKVHALSLKLYTSVEWSNKDAKVGG